VLTAIQRHICTPNPSCMRSRGSALLGTLLIGVVFLSTAAHAQSVTGASSTSGKDAGQGSDASAGGVEEVVVTARKREERVQDVPISLAILTSEALEKSGVTNLEDLGHEVPGLTVVSGGPGQNQITLRGLSGNNTVGL